MQNTKEFLDDSHGWKCSPYPEEPDKIDYGDVPEYMWLYLDYWKKNVADIRTFLLEHPDQDMIKQACLHYLGDAHQKLNENNSRIF